MQANELRNLLKARSFEPIEVGLSDGRSVAIRHPDQAVVTARKVFVGLTEIRRSGKLRSPAGEDAVAKGWILIDLVHVVSVEPINGRSPRRKGQRRP